MSKKKNPPLTVEEDGQNRLVTWRSDTIRTIPELIAAAKVDLDVWEPSFPTLNKWDVQLADGKGVTQMFQVKVPLKRRAPDTIEMAFKALEKRLSAKAPVFPKIKRPKHDGEPHLVVPCLFDPHFGKLAWARETGEDWDLKLSNETYSVAMDELIAQTKHLNIEHFIFPVGSDFFHIDNARNETTAGTPQDVDTRLAKIFEVGTEAVQIAISKLLQIAPVEVIYVPGNHDKYTSLFMSHVLRAYFRNTPDVTVCIEPRKRTHRLYGVTLIGLDHGDTAQKDQGLLLAAEAKDEWSRATFREILTGHYHKQGERRYTAGDTFNGVRVITCPSLSGTDAWHYQQGYVKNVRASEARVYGKKSGPLAVFTQYGGL